MKNNNLSVLFVDSTHPVLVEKLTRAGMKCDYRPDISRREAERCIHKYDGVVIRSKLVFDKKILEKAGRLKFIGRVGSGLENIDTEYATSRKIACFKSPEGNRDAVGEHALGLLLAVMNNICKADKEVSEGKWFREVNRGTEIMGKTVGIIGYGNTGNAFARCLQGFKARVLAYDKYKFSFSDDFVTESSLEEIFEEADILSLHVPLTNETNSMADISFLQNFKKDIFLINTSRGKVVSTPSLVECLRTGKVKGAGLDVLEYEKTSFEELHRNKLPDDFSYLTEHSRVVMTPHIAGWTHESNIKLAEILADKITACFGKLP